MFNFKFIAGRRWRSHLFLLVCIPRAARRSVRLETLKTLQQNRHGAPAVDEVVVIAQRLNEARNGIQTQTGASTYTINEAAIDAAAGRRQSIAQPSDHAGAGCGPGLVWTIPRAR